MKTDGPQSLHEGSDLSWKVPGEQAHSLHRGRCSLQEAALQRASLVWTGASSHCGRSSAVRPPLTGPAGLRGPVSAPHPQAGWTESWGDLVQIRETHQVHCKTTAKQARAPPPAGLPSRKHAFRIAAGPGVTAHTRHTLSRLLCGQPSRQSLIFKERLTMYYS